MKVLGKGELHGKRDDNKIQDWRGIVSFQRIALGVLKYKNN